MNSEHWIDCKVGLPENGVVVMTKIDDAQGCRNVQKLIRADRLWFLSDSSMYVYYTPTHWRTLNWQEEKGEVSDG